MSLSTGTYNTAIGIYSLLSLTDGQFCTGVGAGTLLANTGNQNTATGAGALFSNTEGAFNTANGAFALFSNTTGFRNTANGIQALFDNTTGSFNTAIGNGALHHNTEGSFNTAIDALPANTTGDDNVALGFAAGLNVTTADHVICIGAGVQGANVSNSCYIGQIFGEPVDPATAAVVLVDTDGKLGTSLSSRRFKHDIQPMDKASEAILRLKPVTFHYTSDPKSTPCFGLIAEEVAEVNPDLVVRDKNGELLTVRYDQVNVMLLNEFLKEHGKVEQQGREMQEQKATISQLKTTVAKQEVFMAEQRRGMQALAAQLREQHSKIQKVSDQLEVTKPAQQMVRSNQ